MEIAICDNVLKDVLKIDKSRPRGTNVSVFELLLRMRFASLQTIIAIFDRYSLVTC